MKSPPFEYVKVHQVEEALALLQTHRDDARILAGGQTLLATLNMRLSEPALLIDIAGIDALRGIERVGDWLRIGAMTTHSEIESSALVAEHAPLLTAAVPHIAHRAIRNSGTWGGSIAYGDPAAEWPCCLVAMEGVITVQGPAGQRRIAATDFFLDLYTTDLQPDEIVVSADVPIASTGEWFAFDELARRHGDYAVAGVAVAARFDGLVAQRVRLGFLGMGLIPLRAPRTEALLSGKVLDETTIEIALLSLKGELDPLPDLTHSSQTKNHLATVLTRRLLTAAHASRSALMA
jgi:carbon-monoxide dehydrogenase medium subunit